MPYQALLDRVIPGMVMERRLRRNEGTRLRRRGGPPVVEIVVRPGVPDSGLLGTLYRRYAEILPINHPAVPLTDSPVHALLYLSTKAGGLGRDLPYRRPMTFPRFALGMLAYSSAEREGRPELAAIERAHKWLERELLREHAEGRGQAAGDALLTDLERSFPQFGTAGGVMGVLSALGRFLLARPRPDRVALHWWGAVLRIPRGGVTTRRSAVATTLFNVHWHGADAAGHTPVQLLAAAFLADIDAHYGLIRRLNNVRPPVVLLPDLHTPAGCELLSTLLAAYDIAFEHRPAWRTVTRPVVIATARSSAEGLASVTEIETELNGWRRGPGETSEERWLLRVRAPGTPGGER